MPAVSVIYYPKHIEFSQLKPVCFAMRRVIRQVLTSTDLYKWINWSFRQTAILSGRFSGGFMMPYDVNRKHGIWINNIGLWLGLPEDAAADDRTSRWLPLLQRLIRHQCILRQWVITTMTSTTPTLNSSKLQRGVELPRRLSPLVPVRGPRARRLPTGERAFPGFKKYRGTGTWR